ncbi:Translin, partial [Paramuricea clavata]
ISAICQQAEEMFGALKLQFSELILLIPAGQYYRFHDHWRFVSQRASFLASFLVYLQFDRLITREEVATMLGIKVKREEGFHIDLDDFLTGLLLLANELSRLAVNCVTAEEYQRPQKIASFVSELDAGFRLLNLKNDSLRKKFDGLKYDLKKIEEVVYDIKIRGLIKS